MGDGIKIRISVDGISKKLNEMRARAEGEQARGWLNRVAYPMLMRAQRERWSTQGASEGRSWDQLTPKYEVWKKKHYAGYPGSGGKLMVATSQLYRAVVGEDQKYHRKLVSGTTLEIWIEEDSPASGKSKKRSLSRIKRVVGERTASGAKRADFSAFEVPPLFYAGFANEKRDFIHFGDETIGEIRAAFRDWVKSGTEQT